MPVERIVSGGQTGVDRGALDAAIELGIPHGGWCPVGRRSESGRIPARYQLQELPSRDYAARTGRNVADSDATLIVCHGELRGGTALTARLANEYSRPCLVIDVSRGPVDLESVRAWLREHDVRVLNVAGPRASSWAAGHDAARDLLVALLGSRLAHWSLGDA